MEHPDILIEKAQSKHVHEIACIEKESFSRPWSEKGITDELVREDSLFYVGIINDTVCGFINCRNICGEGYIGNLAVKSVFRKQGVGKALLSYLINQAVLQQIVFLTLEVRETNLPAIRLYESFGFRKVGIRKRFYSDPVENAVLYTLDSGRKYNENIIN